MSKSVRLRIHLGHLLKNSFSGSECFSLGPIVTWGGGNVAFLAFLVKADNQSVDSGKVVFEWAVQSQLYVGVISVMDP